MKIGLCLSGGGHRATLFSLGALLYLADSGHHKYVSTVSSVSGGSLAAGYLATRSKPLHELTAEEVEATITSLAHRMVERKYGWSAAFMLILIVVSAWLMQLVGVLHGWWGSWALQAVMVTALMCAAVAAARMSGGTFWGWWGTWLYLELLFITACAAVIALFSSLHWTFKTLVLAAAVSLPIMRCHVAEWAFAATLFADVPRRKKLADLRSSPRYVFCSTEMHSGEHAWFTHDLVYIARFGVGSARQIRVNTAVQVSANFPVAFPYRIIRRKRHGFQLQDVERQSPFIVLTDGGVNDNMATSWLRLAAQTARNLHIVSRGRRLPGGGEQENEAFLKRQLDAMGSASVDHWIIVNSSEPYSWKRAGWSWIPIWGELKMLQGVNDAMYNQLGLQRKNSLIEQFLQQPNSGAVVSIGDPPRRWLDLFSTSHGCEVVKTFYGVADGHIEGPRSRAGAWADALGLRAMFEKLDLEISELESRLTEREGEAKEALERVDIAKYSEFSRSAVTIRSQLHQSKVRRQSLAFDTMFRNTEPRLNEQEHAVRSTVVRTTFRPLPKDDAVALLAHGYLSTMINCHLMLNFPLLRDSPSIDEFRAIADGSTRNRREAQGISDATPPSSAGDRCPD